MSLENKIKTMTTLSHFIVCILDSSVEEGITLGGIKNL